MSVNTEQVEQITKEPSNVQKKEKDPKRVAAGKKLAEKNKQMREEHARYKASEEARRVSEAQRATDSLHKETEPETETGGVDLLSQLSLTNVISLVGIGLTVYTIFFSKSGEKRVAWQEPVHTTFEEPKSKPKPKFGM